MSDCGCQIEAQNAQERRTLRLVLGINALMFVLELGGGIVAQSTGLMADSLDMFADASVYLMSLFAVGKHDALKVKAAKFSGLTQIGLAGFVVVDVVRRFLWGSEPWSALIVGMGILALGANSLCLSLIAKHRTGGVHMRASYIFSQNDVVANLGVIASGFLVSLLQNRYPDLIIGVAIALVVLWGGIKILRDDEA